MKTTFVFSSDFSHLSLAYADGAVAKVSDAEELAQIIRTHCIVKSVSDELINGETTFEQAARFLCISLISQGENAGKVLVVDAIDEEQH